MNRTSKILLIFIIIQIFYINNLIAQNVYRHSKDVCTNMWNLKPIGQETENWCYAATTQFILKYYGINKSQCEIVGELLPDFPNKAKALDSCKIAPCGTYKGQLNQRLNSTLRTNIVSLFKRNGLTNTRTFPKNKIDFNLIKTAIDSCKPILLFASIGRNSNHIIAITGYIEKEGCNDVMVLVKDPLDECKGCEVFMIYNKTTKNFDNTRNNRLFAQSVDNPNIILMIPSK